MDGAVTRVDLPLPLARSGKVRECFDVGGRLLLVATDRISAFDCVFARGIPGKGRVLTGISRYWFDALDAGAAGAPPIPHHMLSADAAGIVRDAGLPRSSLPLLEGRTMLVVRAEPVPVECVVRGYLEGSALAEYRETGRVAGLPLPPGLRRAERLPHAVFTPARKASSGHDENISFDEMARALGAELAETLRDLSLRLYVMGATALADRGLLLADTKFEFGLLAPAPDAGAAEPEPDLERLVLLIDEVLTPDSSRIWEADAWNPGDAQSSFDKQPLRDYLEGLARQGRWDKRPPAPDLPDAVVRETAERYAQAHLRITGRPLAGDLGDEDGTASRGGAGGRAVGPEPGVSERAGRAAP